MYRMITAGCVLALGLLTPILAAHEKVADNPAAQKLNRDIPRHKEFLKRIEQSKGLGDIIFLGDSICTSNSRFGKPHGRFQHLEYHLGE